MALKDAYETVNKEWSALASELRPRIARRSDWSQLQKRYAYWLIKSPQRLAQLMAAKATIPTHFEISFTDRKKVQNYLRRVIRRNRGRSPRVRSGRSAAFDANMYEVFEEEGAQYIKVMSLHPRERIVIPLTGKTPIRGNIRLVLDWEQRRAEIHYTSEVKAAPSLTGEPCGLDAGVSEVFTDEQGNRYGGELGEVLVEASNHLTEVGRKRNRLHQIAKKAEARGDKTKANRIRKFNLGRKKLRATRRKARCELERQINAAMNEVLRQRQPSAIATERLDIRGKAKSKHLSRKVSLWTRHILKERVDFKASAGGSRREQVNPAYSSQMCPNCGFVHRDNRRGDAFQCLYCGHEDSSDRVAAYNLRARLADPQITLWTPKERVKAILLMRFTARLESGGSPATVSGWTPETCVGGANWLQV
jgi:transposase